MIFAIFLGLFILLWLAGVGVMLFGISNAPVFEDSSDELQPGEEPPQEPSQW